MMGKKNRSKKEIKFRWIWLSTSLFSLFPNYSLYGALIVVIVIVFDHLNLWDSFKFM